MLACAGLAPEMVWFHPKDDMQPGSNANQLRPEVLESFFYMWRFTGDSMYQQWAWQIFQSFQKYSKLDSGYAGLEVRHMQLNCIYVQSLLPPYHYVMLASSDTFVKAYAC